MTNRLPRMTTRSKRSRPSQPTSTKTVSSHLFSRFRILISSADRPRSGPVITVRPSSSGPVRFRVRVLEVAACEPGTYEMSVESGSLRSAMTGPVSEDHDEPRTEVLVGEAGLEMQTSLSCYLVDGIVAQPRIVAVRCDSRTDVRVFTARYHVYYILPNCNPRYARIRTNERYSLATPIGIRPSATWYQGRYPSTDWYSAVDDTVAD